MTNKWIAATIALLFVVPGFAQAPGQCSCDQTEQTRLLRADIKVGIPTGMEKYTPEARFGVYFAADMANGLDLWFSNPLIFPTHEKWVMGQSHDRDEVSAYRIMAAPTLRDSLLEFARAQGYPRQNVAAECQSMLKDEPRR
jgi:hypothetical protein